MNAGKLGRFDSEIEKIVRAYDIMAQTINPLIRLKLGLDMTPAQLKVLMGFELQGRYAMTSLSRDNAVTVSTMTSMIDRLVQLDLVARCNDERDRRKVLVCLTENGRRISEKVVSFRRTELERFLDGLGTGEVAEFVESIEKTAHFLSKANKSAVA